MASHKPRKKRHLDDSPSATPSKSLIITDTKTNARRPAFPLIAFLWPARGSISTPITIILILLVCFLFRLGVSFWDYSGYASPPMHGDFEAQRHWMEITTALPISHWYFHDLEWWGLDYPPLTAYHSYLCGRIGMLIDRSWFALRTSRGLDEQGLKVFMRGTVLASEFATYIPAAVLLVRRYARLSGVATWESCIALTALLMQPATMLIDHGHFQYNTVMLGFLLASMSCLMRDSYAWACIFFVASLGFKQMALFYAPALFCYLLGSCISPRLNITRFLTIALTTALAFAALYAPLLLGTLYDDHRNLDAAFDDMTPPPLLTTLTSLLPFLANEKAWTYAPLLQLTQSLHRIFPFARGLFEDKVANLWCALHASGLYKLSHLPAPTLQRLALLATLAAITPPCLILLSRPRKDCLPYGLAAVSWAFFLCSYQVHEKNVLLPLLPMTLLLAGTDGLGKSTRAWVGWANVMGCWTMFPLLRRDGLRVPYFVVTGLWCYLLGLPPTSLELYVGGGEGGGGLGWVATIVHGGGYAAMGLWHVGEAFVAPPESKPDLWVVANAVVGAGGFGVCYLWCLWGLLAKSGLLRYARKNVVKKTQ